jgi:hypothetical protein
MLAPRTALTALSLLFLPSAAAAQPAPPPAAYAPPPAGYAPPPAAYAPPPSGYVYAYPGAYGAPAPTALGPAILPYADGYPIPDGYRPEMRFRTSLIIAGAAVFGAMYGLSIASTAGGGDKSLLAPIVGPFIAAGRLGGSELAPVAAVFLVLSGLAQTGGVVMLAVGIGHKKQVLVRQDVAATKVRLTPLTMGHGGLGLGLGLVGEM